MDVSRLHTSALQRLPKASQTAVNKTFHGEKPST